MIDPVHNDNQEQPETPVLTKIKSKSVSVKKFGWRRLMKAVRDVIIMILVGAVVLVSGALYMEYKSGTLIKTRYVVDYRPCSVSSGDYTISGKRYYSYPEKEILGYRIIDKSKVEEKTEFDFLNVYSTVIMLDGTESKHITIDGGTRSTVLLPNVPEYAFIFGDDRQVVVAEYNKICK